VTDRRTLLRSTFAVPAVAALTLSGSTPASAAVADPPGPFPDGTYAVLCAGTSITAGSTADPANGIAAGYPADLITGNGYRKQLYDDLRIRNERPINMVGSRQSGTAHLWHEGHPGATINEIAAYVGTGLAPQFVILEGGANDFGDAHLRTWDQAIADMGALVDKVLAWAPWTRVVVCADPEFSGFVSHDLTKSTWQIQSYNAALPGLVADKGGRVVLAHTNPLGPDMLDAGGVHPNDVGYRWMAYGIYYALAPWLGHDVGAGGGRWMTSIAVPPGSPRPLYALP
jgi:lysophospholipase L1-like esterase